MYQICGFADINGRRPRPNEHLKYFGTGFFAYLMLNNISFVIFLWQSSLHLFNKMASPPNTVNVLVSGDIVAPGLLLESISSSTSLIALSKHSDLQGLSLPRYKFYKNADDEVALNPLETVASLPDEKGTKVVFVRPVPAAGAYLHKSHSFVYF